MAITISSGFDLCSGFDDSTSTMPSDIAGIIIVDDQMTKTQDVAALETTVNVFINNTEAISIKTVNNLRTRERTFTGTFGKEYFTSRNLSTVLRHLADALNGV